MRKENWQAEYHRAIATAQLLPFQWGVHDCVTFAAYLVDAISDLDVTARFKAKYRWTNQGEAARLILAAGSLQALVTEFMGPPISWVNLSLGDALMAFNNGKEIVCIHDGHNLIAPADKGLMSVPLSSAICGWRI